MARISIVTRPTIPARCGPTVRALAISGETAVTHRFAHPVNVKLDEEAPPGARIADRVTGFLGSWPFIIVQTVIVLAWLAGNAFLLTRPFDPYPFILLNLAFSTQAAYAAPLILLAGNRAALRDRMTLEHAAAEADIEDAQNRELLQGNVEILKRVEGLEKQILGIETSVLAAIQKSGPRPAGWTEPTSRG
jgi:uncharacterized membrane protein